jgi:catalase
MRNAKGKVTFVKFHWKPKLGLQSTLWDEALKLQAADNDYHRRDLWEAINSGAFPEWELRRNGTSGILPGKYSTRHRLH